jgi:hypothetical protein
MTDDTADHRRKIYCNYSAWKFHILCNFLLFNITYHLIYYPNEPNIWYSEFSRHHSRETNVRAFGRSDFTGGPSYSLACVVLIKKENALWHVEGNNSTLVRPESPTGHNPQPVPVSLFQVEVTLQQTCKSIYASYFGLLVDPEDGGCLFFWNVGWLSSSNTALYPRR